MPLKQVGSYIGAIAGCSLTLYNNWPALVEGILPEIVQDRKLLK